MSVKVEEIVPDAQRLLSELWGRPIALEQVAARRDNAGVYRIAGSDEHVFLKRPPLRDAAGWEADATDPRSPAARMASELAALEVLRDTGRIPELLASDGTAGFFALGVLDGPPLHVILLDGDATAATEALVALFDTLGRLQAHAASRIDAFTARRAARTSAPLASRGASLRANRPAVAQRFESLGLPADERAAAAADALLHDLVEPGAFSTLVHGDPCPDNAIRTAEGVTLLDFESAAPGHALLDGVYLRMGWPTCWCAHTCPEPVLDRAEAAYRRALAEHIGPASDDDAWKRALAVACLAQTLATVHHHLDPALDEDVSYGVTTLRARVLSRLRLARIPLEAAGQTAVADWLDRIDQLLSARWPNDALTVFPALRRG